MLLAELLLVVSQKRLSPRSVSELCEIKLRNSGHKKESVWLEGYVTNINTSASLSFTIGQNTHSQKVTVVNWNWNSGNWLCTYIHYWTVFYFYVKKHLIFSHNCIDINYHTCKLSDPMMQWDKMEEMGILSHDAMRTGEGVVVPHDAMGPEPSCSR